MPRAGAQVQLYSFFSLGARFGGGVINATPRPVYSRERDPVPIVQEAAWALGSVWPGVDNLSAVPEFPERKDCVTSG
jgi:hypothetical protein